VSRDRANSLEPDRNNIQPVSILHRDRSRLCVLISGRSLAPYPPYSLAQPVFGILTSLHAECRYISLRIGCTRLDLLIDWVVTPKLGGPEASQHSPLHSFPTMEKRDRGILMRFYLCSDNSTNVDPKSGPYPAASEKRNNTAKFMPMISPRRIIAIQTDATKECRAVLSRKDFAVSSEN